MSSFALSFWCASADLTALPSQSGGVLLGSPPPPDVFNDTNTKVPVADFSYVENVGATDTLNYPYAGSDHPGEALSPAPTTEYVTFSLVNSGGPFFVQHTDQSFSATAINMSVSGSAPGPITPISAYYFNDPSQAYALADANHGTPVFSHNASALQNLGSLSTLYTKGQSRIDDADPIAGPAWTNFAGSIPATTWTHVMISYNSSTRKFLMYFNDTSVANETLTQVDDVTTAGGTSSITLPDDWTLPFTLADYVDGDGLAQKWNICGRAADVRGYSTLPDGSGEDQSITGLQINLVELWFDKHFMDWSVSGNRAKFHVHDAGSTIWAPCSLGANGQLPTGSNPSIYLSGGPSSFPINRATSTTLDVYGAVQASSVTPPT